MPDLRDIFADLSGPTLTWITGQVAAVDASGRVTLSYGSGSITNVASLDQYTPVVGDRVEALSLEEKGVIILGSNNQVSGTGPSVVAQAPVIFSPTAIATYGPVSEAWQLGLVEQAPGRSACFFYEVDFSALTGRQLQTAEIELVLINGGPPEFVGHTNQFPSGVLVPTGVPWNPPTTLVEGAAVWVPLSIGLGLDLISGAISGICISSSGQFGSYSGTGRVRLTPMSVTI